MQQLFSTFSLLQPLFLPVFFSLLSICPSLLLRGENRILLTTLSISYNQKQLIFTYSYPLLLLTPSFQCMNYQSKANLSTWALALFYRYFWPPFHQYWTCSCHLTLNQPLLDITLLSRHQLLYHPSFIDNRLWKYWPSLWLFLSSHSFLNHHILASAPSTILKLLL